MCAGTESRLISARSDHRPRILTIARAAAMSGEKRSRTNAGDVGRELHLYAAMSGERSRPQRGDVGRA